MHPYIDGNSFPSGNEKMSHTLILDRMFHLSSSRMSSKKGEGIYEFLPGEKSNICAEIARPAKRTGHALTLKNSSRCTGRVF